MISVQLLLLILITSSSIFNFEFALSSSSNDRIFFSTLPASINTKLVVNAPPVNWNEQIGITFDESYTHIVWNVTAKAQEDEYGYGPAYLLNGLTEMGYWYQVGLAYNWPLINGGYLPGFSMLYEVFDGGKNSIYPSGGGSGLISFSGKVRENDTVLLSLKIDKGIVYFEAYDLNSGAYASTSYPAYGTKFMGYKEGKYNIANSNGYFTGLMTEWYHVYKTFEDELPVLYSSKFNRITSAWPWAVQWNIKNLTVAFFISSQYPFNLTTNENAFNYLKGYGTNQFISYNYNGYTTYITGSKEISIVNIRAKILNSSFKINLTLEVDSKNFTINDEYKGFIFTRNSPWKIPNLIEFDNKTRLATLQKTSGFLNDSFASFDFIYYLQYNLEFKYKFINGNSSMIPSVTYVSFGKMNTILANTSAWVDRGTTFNYTNPINISERERFFAYDFQGIADSPRKVEVLYFHQFYLIFKVNDPRGGIIENESGWYNATQKIKLSVKSNEGWKFIAWFGNGLGSYNGTSENAEITVLSAITQTAIFYVSFSAIAIGQGSILLEFGNNVLNTKNITIYVKPGEEINISAKEDSIFYTFEGWSLNGNNINQRSMRISINEPTLIIANFGINYYNVTIILSLLILAIILIAIYLRKRR